MHELSIVTSVVQSTEEEVKKINGTSVREIHLEIGKLSGVEMSSFLYVWPQCIKNTSLEHAELIINEPEGKATCAECGTPFDIKAFFDSCPNCNSPFKNITQGKEMKIKKLIIQ
ncbi:hydrogenase maturation nickel metallochaperone HypA [Flavobacterium sp. NRK F10]|uniref:Hydrogenase maturation factor HypA n=1 Tax=Flavobacterium sediminis TaxID=2201181 RepID=A0A2U8QRH9_9FLAO|nr:MULTISPECIES: hydrogenase maturation nickel metallochaperone HypA [Flavobacterium]AWM12760.1 hydrogenase expression protein [Flavobacterium sediminis]MCO6173883.1 hydrogenase maturation nickel metallochaperone HypA [Flavobacterium sp. NRK F10]